MKGKTEVYAPFSSILLNIIFFIQKVSFEIAYLFDQKFYKKVLMAPFRSH